MDKELSTARLRKHALCNLHSGRSPVRGLARFLSSGQGVVECAKAITKALPRMNELLISYRLEAQ